MKRFIGIIISSFLILSFFGCNQYARDNSSGSITEVTLDESLKLAKEEDETIILYSLTTCSDCIALKAVLSSYLDNHSVEINEVVLDNEGTSDEEIQANREKINTVFEDFNAVPSLYYLKDGKLVDEAVEITTEDELEAWVIKNKLDKK